MGIVLGWRQSYEGLDTGASSGVDCVQVSYSDAMFLLVGHVGHVPGLLASPQIVKMVRNAFVCMNMNVSRLRGRNQSAVKLLVN